MRRSRDDWARFDPSSIPTKPELGPLEEFLGRAPGDGRRLLDLKTQRRRNFFFFASLRLGFFAFFFPVFPGSHPDRRWHITSPP